MELFEIHHNRYRLAPTAVMRTHEVIDKKFVGPLSPIVPKLVLHYNNEVQNENFDHSILEILFTTLCYDYQTRIHSKVRCIPTNFDDSFFKNIIKLLVNNTENYDEKILGFLLDILVLEMILYSSSNHIKIMISMVEGNNEMTLRIISSLIDALYLNSYIHEEDGGNQLGFDQIIERIKYVLKPTPDANDKYFALLSSIIHKLVITFTSHDVIYFLWSSIMADEHKDEQLKSLKIVIDSILSITENINVVYICKDEVWHLICYGLKSDVEEQWNEAVCLMKKLLDYVKKEDITVEKNSLIPFVGCQRNDGNTSAQEMKSQFLLILECLEENETHRILAALDHLDNLIKSSLLHEDCGNCFDRMYLRCIFKRILNHKTQSVMRKGLSHLLQMDPAMFDDNFITMLVDSLNNTSLYETESSWINMKAPEIVQELSSLFFKAEHAQVSLINRFICKASTCNWSKIPFFYLFISLTEAVDKFDDFKTNIWTLQEYQAMVKMIEKNIKTQTPPLRELIVKRMPKILSRCVGRGIGLDSIALILFALGNFTIYGPSNYIIYPKDIQGFDRMNCCEDLRMWNVLINYLEKKVDEKDAVTYVRDCCQNFTAAVSDFRVEYFVVMTLLLAEVQKEYFPSFSYAYVLANVFHFVRDIHSRPYANMTILLRVIQFYTCVKIRTMYGPYYHPRILKIVFSVEEEFWQILINSLKSSKTPKSYNEAQIYIDFFQLMWTYVSEKNRDGTPDFFQFYQEAWAIIDNKFEGDIDPTYCYALHIVGICNKRGFFCDYTAQKLNTYWMAFMETPTLKLETTSCCRDNQKMILECYGVISQLLEKHIVTSHDPKNNIPKITVNHLNLVLPKFYILVENGKEYVITGVITILKKIHLDNEENFTSNCIVEEKIFDLSRKILLDCEKSNLFWKCLHQLFCSISNSIYAGVPISSVMALNHLETWIFNLKNIQYAKMILMTKINFNGPQVPIKYPDEFVRLLHILLTCFLEEDTTTNEEKNEENICYLFEDDDFDSYMDAHCQATIVSAILSGMIALSNDSFVEILISKLKHFEGQQYLADSQIHRQKNRLMQLLLSSHNNWSESTIKFVHDSVCKFIVHEIDQPTVCVLQQWLLALIYIKNPTMQEQLWELLQECKDKRPESIPSVVTIIYHVSLHVSAEEECIFIAKAIQKLLPCCLSSQFQVCLYSQVVLSKFFYEFHEKSDLSAEYSMLDEALRESLQNGNLKNDSERLAKHFLFALFDPIENYDLQTIFYDLPKLLNIPMRECIHPRFFYSCLKYSKCNVNIINPESKLSLLSTSDQELNIE